LTLFSRLFAKPSPARSPQPSASAERAATAAAAPERLLATALGPEDLGVRIAAIRQLPDGEALRRLAGTGAAHDRSPSAAVPAVTRAARERIARLVDAGAVDFEALRAEVTERTVLLGIAALCQDAGLLPKVLAAIDDPTELVQLALEGPGSRVRQLAAEAIHDPMQLRELLRQVRHKDKTVYKIVKQKCDALTAAERQVAEWTAETTAALESLERHARRYHDALYAPSLEHMIARWRALTPRPDPALDQQAERAIDRCREVIAAHRQLQTQKAAHDAAEAAAREERARALEADRAAARAQIDADARRQLEEDGARAAAEGARAVEAAAHEQWLQQLGGLIGRAHSALRDGQTQRAAGLRRAIEQRVAGGAALPVNLARQLRQLDEKLDELKQWKEHAVAPKRRELITSMEALIGSPEAPAVLARRIQGLRQDWRTISQGLQSEAPEDWQRFDRAAAAAYQPCREHFEAQGRQRRENWAKRQALLERLTAFEAAQATAEPDWRLIARVLREAPLEWRRYFPVEREPNRLVQPPFDASLARLQAKLDAWYEATDAVKRLQVLWQEAAPGPRAQEQSLWSEFREVCDALYQKRQQAFADQTAALEAARGQAVALCEQAEALSRLSGAELLAAGPTLAALGSAYDALEEMPRAEVRVLQDRFERARRRCADRMAQQHALDAQRAVVDLLEAGGRIGAYAWAVALRRDEGERARLKQAAEAFMHGVPRWPKGGLATAKATLAQAEAATDSDAAARERTLRLLCVRAEILSERATPPEDEALRRNYQVQRLIEGMGQGGDATDGGWDTMLLDWVRHAAVAPALHDALRARFVDAWARRPAAPPR
jgi:hypothetical protein